jgi:hypothetical protein
MCLFSGMEPLTLFDDIAEELAIRGVTSGKVFGNPSLKYEGKAFACLKDGSMAFRLGAGTPAHTEALALDGAELFDPAQRHAPFKDWVDVPAEQSDHWLGLAEAGLDYLSK